MLPELTAGALDRIVNGEDVSNVVVQLLGCKKIPGSQGDRYRLLISDGVTSNYFVMLGLKLNHMVLNKELELYTILQIDEYSCTAISKEEEVILLTKLTVLVPGIEVYKKLGNPVNSSTCGTSTGAATNTPVIGGSVQSKVVPQLTTGAINRILNGVGVPKPVIQILGCRNDYLYGRYCLLISDGATAYPFALLHSKMDHMVTNKQLLIHTVVRLDKYKCHPGEKVIDVLKLTVLVPGDEIKKELGNPVNYIPALPTNCTASATKCTGATTKAAAGKGVAKTSDSKINTVSRRDSSAKKGSEQLMMQMMFPELTNGAINRIFNQEDVANAVLQILEYEKMACDTKYRYSLLISDGVTCSPFAILAPELNHLVTNKELEEYAIVQVTKCTLEEIHDFNVIILLSLTVVVPGNEVNEKLGNPVLPTIDQNEDAFGNTRQLVQLSQLTNHAISRILNGEVVENAIIMIVACRKLPEYGDYYINIFDGEMAWPFTKLGKQLKHLGENKELTKFPVRVDKYVCNQTPGKPKEIILLGLTLLGPENGLQNPVNSSDVGATARALQQLKIV